MAQLKRLGVMSVAKLYAVLMALVGFIEGLFIAILVFIGAMVNTVSSEMGFAALGFGMGIAAIIILPIILGIFGFIFGAIGAFLYNIIAGKVGGIEMDFE